MSEEDPPGLDLARLYSYLEQTHPELVEAPLRGEVIPGGRSNLTYIVRSGSTEWVLRRPPLGHVLPTAHDMSREHRVIAALHPTVVPVPQPLVYCDNPDVIGAPFYIMRRVTGTAYRSGEQLSVLGAEQTRAIGLSLVDTLVDLHAIAPADVGLEDFGRPDGFLERQLRRWKKQLDGSRSRELPGADQLHEDLVATMPASPSATIVHGDYRLDNALAQPPDRINAVLDWEMSTLGDPLTDLALMVAYAQRDAVNLDVVSSATSAPGYPDEREVVERYAARSGRDVSALNWYVAFALFKLAVILEGIHYRYTHGQTVGEGFEKIGAGVVPLITHGTATLESRTD